jgi:chemotaxis protein methyltransferase CheR
VVYDPVATNTNSMDVIFCRNVLMYFTPQKARAAGRRFFHSLVDKGWFVSSQVELSEDYFEPFARIHFNNGIFYQKAPKTSFALSNTFQTLQSDCKPSPKAKPLKTQPDKKTKPPVLSSEPRLVAIPKPVFSDPEIFFKNGQYMQCVDQCLDLCEKRPDDLKYLLLIVKSYANMGRLQDAKSWGTRLLQNNNTSVEAYHFLATILLELGELEEAEEVLRKALYLDQENIQVLLTMGNVMKRQGKRQLASKCFGNIHTLLNMQEEDDAIPGFEGLTAGRVKAMVEMSIR